MGTFENSLKRELLGIVVTAGLFIRLFRSCHPTNMFKEMKYSHMHRLKSDIYVAVCSFVILIFTNCTSTAVMRVSR